MGKLVECQDCGKKISYRARKCIFCGETISVKIPLRTWLYLVLLLVMIYNITHIDTALSDTIALFK